MQKEEGLAQGYSLGETVRANPSLLAEALQSS